MPPSSTGLHIIFPDDMRWRQKCILTSLRKGGLSLHKQLTERNQTIRKRPTRHMLSFSEFSGGEVMIPGEGKGAQEKGHHRKFPLPVLETRASAP